MTCRFCAKNRETNQASVVNRHYVPPPGQPLSNGRVTDYGGGLAPSLPCVGSGVRGGYRVMAARAARTRDLLRTNIAGFGFFDRIRPFG